MQAFVEGISEAWLQTPCLVSGYNFDFDIGAFRAEANVGLLHEEQRVMAAGMDLVPVLVFEEPAKVPRRTSKKLLQGLRRYQDSFPQANSFLLWLLCLLVISSAPFNAFDEAMLGLGHGAATLCVMAVVFACGPRLGLGDFRHFLTVLALLLWPRSEQRWCRAMLKAGQSPAEVLAPRAALGFVLLDDLLRVVLRYFEGEPAEVWPFAVTSRGLYQLWSQDEEWWEACYRGAAWHRLPVRLAPPSINRLMKEAMLLASMMAETFGMMVLLQNSSTATSWAAAPCIASSLLVVSCSPWLPRQSDLVLVEMSRLLSLVSKFAVYVQDGEGLTGAFFYLETASLVALCTLVTYQLLAVVARCRAASPLYAVPAEEVVTEHASHRSKRDAWFTRCSRAKFSRCLPAVLGSRSEMTNEANPHPRPPLATLQERLPHTSDPTLYSPDCIAWLSHVRCCDEMASGRTLVFGGRGFVGAAICKELAKRGLAPVLSLSRSQPAQSEGSTIQEVGGVDALKPETFESLLPDARAVVIAIGEPPWVTDKERAMRSNGTTNITIMQTAAKHKVPRVVLVNATMPSWGVIAGYREGKLAAEREALSYPEKCDSPCSVLVIKPGAISGTRQEGCFQVPLWLLLEPMRLVMSALSGPCEAIERCFPSLFGGVLRPPVRVEEIAMAAADVVEDTSFKGIREIGTKELVGYTSASSQKKD
eukprot:s907_g14.t1